MILRKIFPGIILLVFFFVFFTQNSHSESLFRVGPEDFSKPDDAATDFVEGELLVKFRTDAQDQIVPRRRGFLWWEKIETGVPSVDGLNREYDVADMQELNPDAGQGDLLAGVYKIEYDQDEPVDRVVSDFQADSSVEYAEPNYVMHLAYTPNDEYFGFQWDLHNSNAVNTDINMPAAWDYDTAAPNYGGDSSVVVAVIDTGVAYEDYDDGLTEYAKAPDFANTAFTAGYDYVNDDTHPNDDHGHGTHVAGTIAQSTGNTTGVGGIAFNSTIMPIKVLDSSGSGALSDVAAGIDFARQNGADVINMSLEGSHSVTLEQAVEAAAGAGVILVAATGNSGASSLSYPAAYSEVIAVGATRYDGTLSSYSNYGTGAELVAPGGDTSIDQNGDSYADGVLQQTIIMDNPNTQADETDPTSFDYYFLQGTSMASPHVAGVIALLLADGVDAASIRTLLQTTAVDHGDSGYDTRYGYGLLDAQAALAAVNNDTEAPTGSITIQGGNSQTTNNRVGLNLSATDALSGVVAMAFSNNGSNFSSFTSFANTVNSWDLTDSNYGGNSSQGTKTVSVKYKDAAGNVSSVFSDTILYNGAKPDAPASLRGYSGLDKQTSLQQGVTYSYDRPFFDWDAPADPGSGIAGYYVYVGSDVTANPVESGIFQSTTGYWANDLSGNDTDYYVRVRTKNGNGEYSDSTTTFIYSIDTEVGPPQDLKATSGPRSVTLTWSSSSDAAGQGVTYMVLRSLSSDGNFEVIATGVADHVRTYVDNNLKSGTKYYYKVRAVDDKGNISDDASSLGNGSDEESDDTTVQPVEAETFSNGEIITAPGQGFAPQIKVFSAKGSLLYSFYAYDKGFKGGVNVAAGDIDGDGVDEIITGTGVGGGPQIRVFNKKGAAKDTLGFFAYASNVRTGVKVAAGDIDGDGVDEIITGTGVGGGPQVRVFDSKGNVKKSFFAYDKNFRGGMEVAVADVSGDEEEEIITGAGPGGGPQIRVFDKNGTALTNFFAYGKSLKTGVLVGGGDIDGDGVDEIITGTGRGAGPQIRIFDSLGREKATTGFFAYNKNFRGGVFVQAGDLNADGVAEIVTGTGAGGGPQIRMFDKKGAVTVDDGFFAYDKNFRGGVHVTVGNVE